MKQRQAFTLIELLIVVALITCMAALSIGQLKFLTRGYARSELDCLYQMCLYAQRHAMMTGRACCVDIDITNNCYMCNGQQHQLSQGVKFGIMPKVKGPPSSPHNVVSRVCTFKNNQIRCSKNGVISAGTIYLTDNRNSLYALTCSVAPYSYLRKYRYADKWQLIE